MRLQKSAMRCSTLAAGAGVDDVAAERPALSMAACIDAVEASKSATVVRARGLRLVTFSAHWPRSAAETQSPACAVSMRAQKSAMRCSMVAVAAGVTLGSVRQLRVG